MYHHVGPLRPGLLPSLSVSPKRFRAQLALLRRLGLQPLTLGQVAAWTDRQAELPPRALLITFDDGYADLQEHAFSVLEQAGFPATVFLVTGALGATTSWDASLGAGSNALLDAGAVERWNGRGIEFGSHSRTHADLTALGPTALREELAGSAEDLAALLSEPPIAVAYPWGLASNEVREAAAGSYRLGFCAEGSANRPGCDPLLLGRTMVQPADTAIEVVLRARLGLSPRERVWSGLHRTRESLRSRR